MLYFCNVLGTRTSETDLWPIYKQYISLGDGYIGKGRIYRWYIDCFEGTVDPINAIFSETTGCKDVRNDVKTIYRQYIRRAVRRALGTCLRHEPRDLKLLPRTWARPCIPQTYNRRCDNIFGLVKLRPGPKGLRDPKATFELRVLELLPRTWARPCTP